MYCYEILGKYIVFFINTNNFAPSNNNTLIHMDTNANDKYHADTTRIGKSGLDYIHQSPAHYYAAYLDPNWVREKQTAALIMGSAVHMATFEADDFLKKFAVLDDSEICAEIGGKAPKQTKAYKEWLADYTKSNPGKTILDQDEFNHCLRIREAVVNHPAASVLLESGVAEQRIDWLWQGADDDFNPIQVKCKSKMDWQSHNGFIVDLKTTEDASPEGFGKSVWNYRYHVQGAFYLDAYEYHYGQPARGFIFIAVEKKPPYAVAVYFLPPDVIDIGRREYEADLRVYHRCLVTNEWPGYPTTIQPIQLPAWAMRKANNS